MLHLNVDGVVHLKNAYLDHNQKVLVLTNVLNYGFSKIKSVIV